jgi:hypothetical protein
MPLASQLFLCDRSDERIVCGRATRPESDNRLFFCSVGGGRDRYQQRNRTLCAHENGELVTTDGFQPSRTWY